MKNIKENIDIKSFTTFKVSAFCNYFIEINNLEELNTALDFAQQKNTPILFLGGGSNILITQKFNGVVVKINLKGIKEKEKTNNTIIISAKAGEPWDEFVKYCVDKNYGGLENLSLIPGNVGTSPIQNIGAYGVEIKDYFHSLKALNIQTKQIEIFTKDNCKFGYRDSFFKNEGKNLYVIIEVSFILSTNDHNLHTSYGAIKDELAIKGIISPTIKDIREAVINIRKSKLPDPEILGNAGSFFKNPIISAEHFYKLKEKYTKIPHYKISEEFIKIPAGWLIEKAGWKGKKIDNVGVHEKQALVLVNYGNASGGEIFKLSESIIQNINEIFKIRLEREVNII